MYIREINKQNIVEDLYNKIKDNYKYAKNIIIIYDDRRIEEEFNVISVGRNKYSVVNKIQACNVIEKTKDGIKIIGGALDFWIPKLKNNCEVSYNYKYYMYLCDDEALLYKKIDCLESRYSDHAIEQADTIESIERRIKKIRRRIKVIFILIAIWSIWVMIAHGIIPIIECFINK